MTKTARILTYSAGVLALLLMLVIAAAVVTRTGWFRNYVREEIISSTEEATGGRVEVGAFVFDLNSFHATVTNFVIHGKEPAGAAPLLRARKIEIYFRLLTSV